MMMLRKLIAAGLRGPNTMFEMSFAKVRSWPNRDLQRRRGEVRIWAMAKACSTAEMRREAVIGDGQGF